MTRRVFISYSHDSEAHKSWVLDLATYLRENGIDALLDQWDVELGDDLPSFMESGIRDTDRVLIISTDNYVQKANDGAGGVGYEKTIASAEILVNGNNDRKFVPIVRNIERPDKLPTFLGAKLYMDLSDGLDTQENREILLKRLHEIAPSKPPVGVSPFLVPEHTAQIAAVEDMSTVLPTPIGGTRASEFDDRFARAFPGIREVTWLDDPEDIKARLDILFEDPLEYQSGKLLGWWRGIRDLPINRYRHIEDSHFLVGNTEMNISRIAVVHNPSAYRKWIYIEDAGYPPVGLYEHTRDNVEEMKRVFGYAYEEYGLVDGSLPITRAEYDDAAAIIDGRPVDVMGRTELRIRHLSMYNTIIAPFKSPLTERTFQRRFNDLMDEILSGTSTFETLQQEIDRLPRID